MRAAIEAGPGAKTAVISKLYPTRSHTGAAQGGMAAALANVEEDSWEWHTFDTVKGGDYLVDQDAAEILAKEAIDAVIDLENMGLPFNRTPEGKIDQRRFGGHTADHGKTPVRRACYAADRTGHMILQTLFQNCVKLGINFFNEFYVLDLVTVKDDDGSTQIAGVVAYELATGDLHVFQSKAVIFATGGFGKIYKTTSNAHTLTGDGVGIVWRKGLPLEDMEFFQFHPTGLAGLGILLTEGARGEGAILRNVSGERFMERYAPTIKDLAPRDIVSRCMQQEVAEGRGAGPHRDYVLLDCTHLGAEVLETKLPDITEFARTYLGVDPVVEPVPVMPTAHYAMGGIPTNNDAQVLSNNTTVVPGLYAAGECACVSVHGSNRLGTNSLLDINVFGKRAGQERRRVRPDRRVRAAARGPGRRGARAHRGSARQTRAPSASPCCARSCRTRWTKGAQVFRTDESLTHVLGVIEELRERFKNIHVDDKGKRYNTDLLEAVELGFLLDIAEVVVVTARNRKESRGGHMRDDYPKRDDETYMKHTMAYLSGDAGLVAIRRPHPPRLEARRHHAVPADGEEVLMTSHRHHRDAPTPTRPSRLEQAPADTGIQSFLVTFIIRRFDPEVDEEPRWVDYDVELYSTDRVLDALHKIKWEVDGSLTFRRSCAHGICGSDAMRINGRNRLACKTLIKDLDISQPIYVEAIKGLPLEKDLIVDMEPFFASYREVQPFLIAGSKPEPGKERIQSIVDREVFDDTTKCILCAACTSSCPVFWTDGQYFGPAAIVNAHRFIFDSRDDAGDVRLDILNDKEGVWRCRTTFNCTEACPRGIEVTKAIAEVKQAVLRGR